MQQQLGKKNPTTNKTLGITEKEIEKQNGEHHHITL